MDRAACRPAPGAARPAGRARSGGSWNDPLQDLYWLLLTSGDAEGLSIARATWTQLPERAGGSRLRELPDGRGAGTPLDARDALLLDLLGDERTTLGTSIGLMDLHTVADLAAYTLAQHLGLPPFDAMASVAERRRRRAEIGNAYLRATGRPERELPGSGVPRLLDPDARRLGEALARATDAPAPPPPLRRGRRRAAGPSRRCGPMASLGSTPTPAGRPRGPWPG